MGNIRIVRLSCSLSLYIYVYIYIDSSSVAVLIQSTGARKGSQGPTRGPRRRTGAPRSSPRGPQNAPKTIFGSKKRQHEAKETPRGRRPNGNQRFGVYFEGCGASRGRPRRSLGSQEAARRKPKGPPNVVGRRLEEETAESRCSQYLLANIANVNVGWARGLTLHV